jgi:hypothetical protein
VDDFEDYNDLSDRIFYTWRGGYGYTGYCGNGTGAIIGHASAPFAEPNVVHGGQQAMPYYYDNTKTGWNACGQPITFAYSEAGASTIGPNSLDVGTDWTAEGVKALGIWSRAAYPGAGTFTPGPPVWTLTADGADIWGTSDQFHYAYQTLSGNGSIVARVQRVDNTNAWAKAGVMMRNTLDADSMHAFVCVTPGNGAAFQNRPTTGGSSLQVNYTGYTAPHWVRLDRSGSTFTGYHANDVGGVAGPWYQIGDPCNISMNTNVYIGLALTSHTTGAVTTGEFTDVSMTGAMPPWQDQDIGIANSNYKQAMYAVLKDGLGQEAVVVNPDANATVTLTWTEWNVALSDFTTANPALNLSNIHMISIGIGDRGNTVAIPDCNGLMYIDDIRLYRPRFMPGLLPPWPEDFIYNGTIDWDDLDFMTDDWLISDYTANPLMGWYEFENNCLDSSGRGNHGDPCGAPTYTTGQIGQAINLDGVDDYVIVGPVGVSGDLPRTIAGWARAMVDPTTIPGWTNLFGLTGPSASGTHFDMQRRGGQDYYCIHVYGWERNIVALDQDWHHLAATYDGKTIKWYHGGNLVDSEEYGELNTYGDVQMGKRGDNNNFFPGLVDDVRIYDKELSAAEIQSILNGGLGSVSEYHPVPSLANLIDPEPQGQRAVNFKDYSELAEKWLKVQVWPED